MSNPRMTLERAMLNVVHDTNGGCWLWSGSMFQHGYGSVQSMGKRRLAHRYFYEHMRGSIPEGMLLLHKCDVRCCVNPDHMFVGTSAHNAADCAAKGRQARLGGVRHPNTHLSAADVAEIRRLCAGRLMVQREIAAKYGITQSNVSMIASGRTWRGEAPVDATVALRRILRLAEAAKMGADVIAEIAEAAREGLTIRHFDELSPAAQGAPEANNLRGVAA